MRSFLDDLPTGHLLLDVSLWSADLAALGTEAARISPLADMLHIDASDTVFTPEPLFCPGLVRAIRSHTTRPLHVHLMAHHPARLAAAFAAAGADMITVHAEAGAADDGIAAIHDAGLPAGLALTLGTEPASAARLIAAADALVLIGTPLGTKGTAMDPAAPSRLAAARHALDGRPAPVLADGGIRRDTVPQLAAAGATGVVPGSLLWASADPAATAAWIRSHRTGENQ
jgi:ribulose-phosphate 3-epimerase